MKKILIIDGQGGMLGKQLVENIKKRLPQAEITAVGANIAATGSMLKAEPTTQLRAKTPSQSARARQTSSPVL